MRKRYDSLAAIVTGVTDRDSLSGDQREEIQGDVRDVEHFTRVNNVAFLERQRE
jgi:hypothetical protein